MHRHSSRSEAVETGLRYWQMHAMPIRSITKTYSVKSTASSVNDERSNHRCQSQTHVNLLQTVNHINRCFNITQCSRGRSAHLEQWIQHSRQYFQHVTFMLIIGMYGSFIGQHYVFLHICIMRENEYGDGQRVKRHSGYQECYLPFGLQPL